MGFRKKSSNKPIIRESENTLHKNLKFVATEQYKLLRANLSFTIPEDQECAIIGVTSAMRGEGKSTTAVNLSYVLAESGKKVLLIDGDMRLPSIARKMRIDNSIGLTDLLKGEDTIQMNQFKSDVIDNWYILPSGNLPPNPSELLGSKRMENLLKVLSKRFDYIVIDLPPVNLVSDALTVSKLITGMVVVIREDYTEKKELETCFRQIKLSDVKVFGCVINETKSGKGSYRKYKYRNHYKYYNKYYKSYGNYESQEADGENLQ